MAYNRHLSFSIASLKQIISGGKIVVHFQPILSTRNHSIIGLEGLIRGISREGQLIPPAFLFDTARKHGLTLDLDRLCREKVLTAFDNIRSLHRNSMLFLNMKTSSLSSEIVGSGHLFNQVTKHNISPANVIIEIVESRTDDTDALVRFVKNYRNCGLNIALDDVGTGHSNFDRISLLQPDIIKIDRSIIDGIAKNYFKQTIFKSLTNLSKKIGALTLAEGVETQEDVLKCIEYGADLLQGYYFSEPKDIIYLKSNYCEQKLKDSLMVFRAKRIDTVRARRLEHKRYQKTVNQIIRKLQDKIPEAFDSALKEIAGNSTSIDALYVINSDGIQMTDTCMQKDDKLKVSPVFRAAAKNENLSHKDYFYQLMNTNLKKFTTDTYISYATGNLCVTLSRLFKGKDGRNYILCTDFLIGNRSSDSEDPKIRTGDRSDL